MVSMISRSHRDPLIEELASRQLAAYNAADLDAFCACYHPDVVVLDADGRESVRGAAAFRARYESLFSRGGFGAEVPQRVVCGEHCVDYERYWREADEGQQAVSGELLVRYRLRDDLIGEVQFFR
jgi:hypothetical protein